VTVAARQAGPLETVWVDVPEAARDAYEAAIGSVCGTVGFFLDEASGTWRVEGVRPVGAEQPSLTAALAVAGLVTGLTNVTLHRRPTEAEGWLARSLQGFPEQHVGRRFAVRGTHLARAPRRPGRITLTLDAGLAFGSGEHGSTRGCLRALELVARTKRGRAPRIIDVGTGSGILAMAAARLFPRRPVLATDIDPWSVRVTRENAAINRLTARVRPILADGWRSRAIRRGAPYDIAIANILARPLCRMARDAADALAPGGTLILAGLLDAQARMVLAAHRASGLILVARLHEDRWTTLVLRRATAR
jgi:ribosomal protein L11 methyltransferase